MDLSGWEITCTEFRPRQQKRASKPSGAKAHPISPPAMETVKKKLRCSNCGQPGHLAQRCRYPRRSPWRNITLELSSQHAILVPSLTRDFPPFHSHLLLRSMEELKSRCFAQKACCIFKNLGRILPHVTWMTLGCNSWIKLVKPFPYLMHFGCAYLSVFVYGAMEWLVCVHQWFNICYTWLVTRCWLTTAN